MSTALFEGCKDVVSQRRHRSLKEIINLRQQYIKSLPKWRRPLVGYLCAIPILLLTLFTAAFLQQVFHRFLFPGTFLLLSLLLVALMWGEGPALIMLLTGIIALNTYFMPIIGQFTLI